MLPSYYPLERDAAHICAIIGEAGFPFDSEQAAGLHDALIQAQAEVNQGIAAAFPPVVRETEFIPKRDNKSKGYAAGIAILRRVSTPFNPASSQQIAAFFIEKYAHEWTVKTDTGLPSTGTKVLATMDFPEAKLLLTSKIVEKRITMLATGDSAFMVKADWAGDGRIHSTYNALGTRTARASCANPNLQQVPKVITDKATGPRRGRAGGWGYEFRVSQCL